MLIKCSVCGANKEDTDFNRVKGKCNTCCYSQEYNKIKEKMGNTDGGEIVYLKKVILSKAKKRSKKKNLEFNLTLSDLINIKNNTCPILGHEILYKSGIDNKRSASLDRVDPNKGYVPDNVKIVSFEGNALKNKNDIDSMIGVMQYYKNITTPDQRTEESRQKLIDLVKDF